MTQRIQDTDLMALSPVQKMELADVLYDAAQQELDAAAVPLSPEQLREIDRRCAAIDAGATVTHDWDTVYERLSGEA